MKKRLISIILSVLMLVSIFPVLAYATEPSLDNFRDVNKYKTGTFKDVSTKNIFAKNIETAYNKNLMLGVSDTKFDIQGNVTYTQAVVVAARIHSIYYTGSADFEKTTPWYKSAADYAEANGITDGNYGVGDEPISRADYAVILSRALPDSALKEINTVIDGQIPDVPMERAYANAVYKLYRAGIITGIDSKRNYNPKANITRGEVAAIITRMIDESLRQKITMPEYSQNTCRIIAEDTTWNLSPGTTIFMNLYQSMGDEGVYIDVECSDNSVVVSNTTGWIDGDNAELYVAGKKAGSAIVTVILKDENGDFLAQDQINVNVIESEEDYPWASELILSEYNVEVPLHGYKKITATGTLYDDEVEQFNFIYVIDNTDIATAEWNSTWDGDTIPLVIKGESKGSTRVYVNMFDYDHGWYLTSKIINVTVK